MITLSLLFIILSGLANAVMDGIQFRWRGSRWERRSRRNDWIGRWLAGWWSPEAWRNKHRFRGLTGLLMRTVLVPFTDAWHFFQLIMWTAVDANLWLWWQPVITGHYWLDLLITLGGIKFVRGAAFELVFSSRSYINAMRKIWNDIITVLYTNSLTASRLSIVVCFLASMAVGLTNQPVPYWRAAVAIGLVVLGLLCSGFLNRWGNRPLKTRQPDDSGS